jgi:hypothetical protein
MKTSLGDSLVIYCYTTVAVNLQISGLVKNKDGEMRAFGPELWSIDGDIEGSITGSENIKVVPALIDGELLAVNVSTPDRNIQNGECYIRGAIRSQMYDTPRAILFADYIALPSPLSFPGSPVVSALAGPGVFKFATLENGVAFELPANSMIKILHILAKSKGTEAGDITFNCFISPFTNYTSFLYGSIIAVANTSEIASVNYFPGAGNKDLTSQSVAIPDNLLTPLGGVTVTIGGVSDPDEEVIQMGYLQWIYPAIYT